MEDKIEEEVMSDEKQLMNGSTALALANFYATRVEDNFRKKLPWWERAQIFTIAVRYLVTESAADCASLSAAQLPWEIERYSENSSPSG